jgi:hypothetical protein
MSGFCWQDMNKCRNVLDRFRLPVLINRLWTEWHWNKFLSKLLRFPLAVVIPQSLYAHPLPSPEMCVSPDQTAHNYILGLNVGVLISEPAFSESYELNLYVI